MNMSFSPGCELIVVMPVYNEQECVGRVVREWITELSHHDIDYTMLVINDGSTDHTLETLQELQREFGERLEIVDRENRGHGQSCIQGYMIAVERRAQWVMQLDSDGQCDPGYFRTFWALRDQHDVVYGHRVRRDDGAKRVVASWVLKTGLLLLARVRCVDANVPYRLMTVKKLAGIVECVPNQFFLANVAMSVLLRRAKWRQAVVPIRFRKRYAGQPKVSFAKFGVKAIELFRQLGALQPPVSTDTDSSPSVAVTDDVAGTTAVVDSTVYQKAV